MRHNIGSYGILGGSSPPTTFTRMYMVLTFEYIAPA